MYWTGRRLVRGRRDGRLVQDLPPLRSVMPALMRTRLEGTVYYTQHLDVEHHEILQACVANEPARASKAVRDHLTRTVDRVAERLERDRATEFEEALQQIARIAWLRLEALVEE